MESFKHHILSEHCLKTLESEELGFFTPAPRLFKTDRGEDYYVFKINKIEDSIRLKADYYIGIDWLVEGEHVIQVEPKINTNILTYFQKQLNIEENQKVEIEEENKKAKKAIREIPDSDKIIELNYLKMLLEVMAEPKTAEKISQLVLIDWEQTQIPITQKKDKLTPFLIVQFLQLLKGIVRKGLKKSYYKKQKNLHSQIKGKVLVGQHIKQNIFRNRLTSVYCEFQVFGEDSVENRFLKKAFGFATAYVENNKELFHRTLEQIEYSINYCRPAFEQVSDEIKEYELKHIKQNPFFKEYKEAIKLGGHILKKFAYNISKTSEQQISTPPFWIDMPGLFELYFYAKILKANPENTNKIHFQFSTYGNALDFLISEDNHKMIIDTKYKLQYKWGKVHKDIRQVSGYSRLNKVRNKLNKNVEDKLEVIDCLIVYPEIGNDNDDFSFKAIAEKMHAITAYHKVYKLGVNLPVLD